MAPPSPCRFSTPLTPTPEERGHPALTYAAWVPTNDLVHGRGNALVMVYKNDIYYKASAAAELVDRVTTTGQPGVVFNGVPDWLYEGEWRRETEGTRPEPETQRSRGRGANV